jgi:folate-binding protein YgfZ
VTGYEALVDGAAWVETESLQAVELTGADVQEWLQGQVTQDLRGVLPGGFCRACLCRATGQLEAVLKFWCLPGRWLALTEAPQAVLGRVQSYVILEDVQAKVLGSSVIGVFGPLADLAVGSPETGWLRADEGWFGIDQRPPTVHQADREAYQTWLLERGVPIFGVDTTERTLPPELGPRFDSTHVAYEKGCYVGQESEERGAPLGRLDRLRRRANRRRQCHADCAKPQVRELGRCLRPQRARRSRQRGQCLRGIRHCGGLASLTFAGRTRRGLSLMGGEVRCCQETEHQHAEAQVPNRHHDALSGGLDLGEPEHPEADQAEGQHAGGPERQTGLVLGKGPACQQCQAGPAPSQQRHRALGRDEPDDPAQNVDNAVDADDGPW